MTSDWRIMQPGPELDRLIAERLGWHPHREGDLWWIFPPKGTTHAALPENIGKGKSTREMAWLMQKHVPRYSTSTDAALLLLSRDIHLELYWSLVPPASWGALYGNGDLSEGHADSPAHAICLAWLAYQEDNP